MWRDTYMQHTTHHHAYTHNPFQYPVQYPLPPPLHMPPPPRGYPAAAAGWMWHLGHHPGVHIAVAESNTTSNYGSQGGLRHMHPVLWERIIAHLKKIKQAQGQNSGPPRMDTHGILTILSFLINHYFRKSNLSNDERWNLVWQLVQYMEYNQVQANSRVWCMILSSIERYKPADCARLYYPTLAKQFCSFTCPLGGYYNAHSDAALIRLMCYCGFLRDAETLLCSRRKAYEEGSCNWLFRFLLYQGLLDYAAVHRPYPRIEKNVLRWINEDGIEGIDDIRTRQLIQRDPTKQINFVGVSSQSASHSRHRPVKNMGAWIDSQ